MDILIELLSEHGFEILSYITFAQRPFGTPGLSRCALLEYYEASDWEELRDPLAPRDFLTLINNAMQVTNGSILRIKIEDIPPEKSFLAFGTDGIPIMIIRSRETDVFICYQCGRSQVKCRQTSLTEITREFIERNYLLDVVMDSHLITSDILREVLNRSSQDCEEVSLKDDIEEDYIRHIQDTQDGNYPDFNRWNYKDLGYISERLDMLKDSVQRNISQALETLDYSSS